MKLKQIIYISLIIFFTNFLVKWYKIDSIPAAHTYDEIIYVSEAQALLKFGTNLAQTWKPTDLEPADGMYTELTSTVLTPGFLLFPNNPVYASKIVPVFFGSLIPVLIALICYYFFTNKKVLIATAVVASANPWLFQFSRTGFDSLFSIFFYLLGIVLILYPLKWYKLLAIVPLFLGFFQYQGHKPLLVPLIFTLCFAVFLKKNITITRKIKLNSLRQSLKSLLPELTIFTFCILLTISYLLRLNTLTSSMRSEEMSLFNQEEISHTVNEQRRLSLDSPFTKIFNNKILIASQISFKRFLKSFDPTYLFLEGNAHVDTFSVLDYGYFHYHDLFLIVFAFLFIDRKKNHFGGIFFLIATTLVGSIPNIIRAGDSWITFRGAFVFIGLVMIVGVTLGSIISRVSSKTTCLILGAYLVLTAPFFYTYFYRYPITYGKHSAFYERVLASYVIRQPDTNFLLITDRADATFDYLATYNRYYQTDKDQELLSNPSAKIKTVNNHEVMITSHCPKDWSEISPDTVVAIDLTKEPCEIPNDHQSQSPKIEIKSLVDSGTRFNIYNDKLCHQHVIHRYQNLKQNYLSVEKLSNQLFCETFFMK